MNTSEEFSKIRMAFARVKSEMDMIMDKITLNYDDFMAHHKKLADEVSELSSKLRFVLEKMNEDKTHHLIHSDPFELNAVKQELKLLRDEVLKSQKKHSNITKVIEDVKKNKTEIKELKTRVKSSELEIYLLRESLERKDTEIKQIKDISRHLFTIVDELYKTEFALMNKTKIK